MSQVKIQGNASGTGILTIAAPNTNSDRTLTLPDATGTMVIQNASSNLLMNSGYGSDAVAYGCRAWVNFNGTGTVAITASGNVTSVTDNGTGDYTVNFTTAMPDANYCAALGGQFDVGSGTGWPAFFGIRSSSGTVTSKTTSALRLSSATYAGSVTDVSNLNVAIFR